MSRIGQRDGLDQDMVAIPSCSLDASGARALKERYRAMAPFITHVSEQAATVVVKFGDDLDSTAITEVIAVEHECCSGVLDFQLDPATRSLKVAAIEGADPRALELFAFGLKMLAR